MVGSWVSSHVNKRLRSNIVFYQDYEVLIPSVLEVVPSDFVLRNKMTNEMVTGIEVSTVQSLGSTQATLTFSGGASVIASNSAGVLPTLANGDYELYYRPISLHENATPIAIDDFLRHYGDSNGDLSVGLQDFTAFRQSFGEMHNPADPGNGYSSGLDANRDGQITLVDFAAFRSAFGT